jgi:putative flippase GtrA
MRMGDVEFGVAADAIPVPAASDHDPLRRLIEMVPRPLRFLSVGAIGLITDLAVFTGVIGLGLHPLLARLVSIAVATVVTWLLNRALTFERSGHHPSREVVLYATVAGCAQAISYVTFAVLVITVFAATPQLAVIIGAAVGALVSYNGQALVTFRPRSALSAAESELKAAP